MDSKLSPMINLVADSLWEEITKVNPAFEEYAKTAEVCYFCSEDSTQGVFQVSTFLVMVINVDF